MSKIKLEQIPRMQSIIRDEAKFRGAASSHNYNGLQENLFFDISNMFNIMSEYENRLQETSELQVVDNIYTQMKMTELHSEILRLQMELDKYRFKSQKKMTIDVFNAEPVEVATTPVINKQFNQINIKNHSVSSKLFLYDEGLDLVTIPSSLRYELNPPAGEGIIDNDFTRAFNGNLNEFFVRKITSDDATAKELEIVIELPDNIISSRNINSIELCPYPYGSVDILDVSYQLNGGWTRIPGLTSHKDYIPETSITEFGDLLDSGHIKDAENVKLCFDKTAMAKIKIKLRQRSYICENNKYVFYIGLKNFNVDCENIGASYSEFYSDIIFNEEGPKLITKLTPYFNNDSILSDQTDEKKTLLSYEFYEVDEDGAMEYMKNALPIVCHNNHYKLLTRVYYDRVSDINPSLVNLTVHYEATEGTTNDTCTCLIKNINLGIENVTIPFNKDAAMSLINATSDIVPECEVPGHSTNTEPIYKYKIKTSTSDCFIEDSKLITKSSGQIVITVEVHCNGKIVKKDFTVNVVKEESPLFTLTYTPDGDGIVIGSTLQKVSYKDSGTLVEAVPNENSQFIEWSDGYKDAKRTDVNVREDLSLIAHFAKATYKVTFKAYLHGPVLDILEVQDIEHGSSAIPPTVPEVEGYKFIGWDGIYTNITANTTISAKYTKTHIVTFVDYNGTVIARRIVDDGQDAIAPTDPVRQGFEFTGWDISFTSVKKDLTVTAQYSIKNYTVRFVDHDNTLLKEETVMYRYPATAPEEPTREGYTFSGWDRPFNSVTSDMTVTAVYDPNQYNVVFEGYDGTILSTQTVRHNDIAAPPVAPNRTGYTFKGWNKL